MRSSHCIDEKRRKNFFFPFEKNQLIAAKLKFAMIFFLLCCLWQTQMQKKDHENLFRKTKNDLVSESFRVELKHKMIGPLINTIGFRLYRFEDALWWIFDGFLRWILLFGLEVRWNLLLKLENLRFLMDCGGFGVFAQIFMFLPSVWVF